jgi:hypothetical protein
MDVVDFLPVYSSVEDPNFYNSILDKKEFSELKLIGNETFPKEKGQLTKYQQTISRYLSSRTPYDKLLIVHSMGLGKCVLPDTIIDGNKIEDLWNEHKTEIITDCDGGEWSKPLNDITIQSYDSKTQKIIPKRVVYLYRQLISENVQIIKTGKKTITMTMRHKLLTSNGWNNKLNVGDMVIVKDLDKEEIIDITQYHYKGYVYDLEVENTHSYIANGIISHNTCSSIGAIEQIRGEENGFDGAIILARGEGLLSNFKNELVFQCTRGQYIPENYDKLTALEKTRRIQKKIAFYTFETFAKFAKIISKLTDEQIIRDYSNKIIVVDEVHNIRSDENENEEVEPVGVKSIDRTKEKEQVDIDFLAELDQAIAESEAKETQTISGLFEAALQEEKKEQAIVLTKPRGYKTYEQFIRLLHLVKNCKIMLLSGTPMKDTPNEIADVANLLLDKKNAFPTENAFISEYMKKRGDLYIMKDRKKDLFKQKLKGLVSFLKEPESDIPKKFVGKEKYRGLNNFIVDPKVMSDFQTQHYQNALLQDKKDSGIYTNSREASLFVFPDGSWGSEGFNKYIKEKEFTQRIGEKKEVKRKRYIMTNELKAALCDKKDNGDLEKLYNHSSIYTAAIGDILSENGNSFAYSSIVKGSGCILFSLILELFGYKKSSGSETTKAKRYILLIGDTPGKQKLVQRFNNPDNVNGEYIQVIIGSKAVSEGYSFNNIVREFIFTPHWNYSEISQAISRGFRFGSHNELLKRGIKPVVRISQYVSIPKTKGVESIFLILYKTSENKDVSIRSIMRLLMECAVDCELNYVQNRSRTGKDGSRECDYENCDFKCDGGESKGIPDYSTYLAQYFNPKVPEIKKQTEQLLRLNKMKLGMDVTIEELSIKLKELGFNTEEIKVFLTPLKGNDIVDYDLFLQTYSQPPITRITSLLTRIFQSRFRMYFNDIRKMLNITEGELLIALNQLITENIVIYNRYGIPSYLREKNNTYFLVSSLDNNIDFFSDYYSRNPYAIRKLDITGVSSENEMSKIILKLFTLTDSKEFKKLIKLIPQNIQNILFEMSISAQMQNMNINPTVRNFIIDYFSSDYRKVNDNTTVSRVSDKLRCVDEKGEWNDCGKEMDELFKTAIRNEIVRKQVKKNGNIYLGKLNPKAVENAFCISAIKDDEKEKIKKDTRLIRPGQNCPTIIKSKLDAIAKDLGIKILAKDKAADRCRKIQDYFESENKIIMDNQCAIQAKGKGKKNI